MPQTQLSDEDLKMLLEMLKEYRARREMGVWMKATARTWIFWLTIAAAIAGGAKSVIEMLWIKHT